MAVCKIDGCSRKTVGRGLCGNHYNKFMKYGDPLATRPKGPKPGSGRPILERFWECVNKTNGCWEWMGYCDPQGYGRLNIDNVPVLAHRISWELHYGPITPKQLVCHKCDNPKCVNPDHFFLGDQAANNADKHAKGRFRYGVSRGEAHGCSKLTEAQVREILASSGKSEDVAALYGVSGRTIREIRNRTTWRHLAA
jgi:hypothetical protein